MPADWRVAGRSGAGGYGSRNDIAVVWPQPQRPVVLAIMSRRDTPDATYDNAPIARRRARQRNGSWADLNVFDRAEHVPQWA